MSKQTITVYVNKERNIYVDERRVDPANLENIIYSQIRNESAASVVLRTDKTVPVQDIVTVIDAVNDINSKNNTQHKVILATKPPR